MLFHFIFTQEYLVEMNEEGRRPIYNLVKDGGSYTIMTPVSDLKRGATYRFSVRRNIQNARSTPVVVKTMRKTLQLLTDGDDDDDDDDDSVIVELKL